jgi:signal peptidase I
MLKLLKVSGDSLLPMYRHGDFVLVSKIPYFLGPITPGDVIVFRHKVYGTMIKKVQSVVPDKGEIYVVGNHENSVDSRQFGAINKRDVVGKVIGHIKRP